MLRRLIILFVGFALGVGAMLVYLWQAGAVEPASPAALARDAPLSITMGEQFLTAIARRSLGGSGGPLTAVVVKTDDGVILVEGRAEILGQQRVATARLRPVLREGRLRIEVLSTELADLPVPMEQGIEDQINMRIRSLLADVPVVFTSVSVLAERGLVVTLRVELDRL